MVSIKDWCVLETPLLIMSWTAHPGCHQICTEIWISIFMFQKWYHNHVFSTFFSAVIYFVSSKAADCLGFFSFSYKLLSFFSFLLCIYFVNATASMATLPLYTMLEAAIKLLLSLLLIWILYVAYWKEMSFLYLLTNFIAFCFTDSTSIALTEYFLYPTAYRSLPLSIKLWCHQPNWLRFKVDVSWGCQECRYSFTLRTLNTLMLRQNGRHFTDDIFKFIFSHETG